MMKCGSNATIYHSIVEATGSQPKNAASSNRAVAAKAGHLQTMSAGKDERAGSGE